MPIYEYECPKCGDKTDAFRHVPDRNRPEPCGVCGHPGTRRLFSFTAQIQTPAHFKMRRGWHLPETKAQHEQLERNLEKLRLPKEEPFGKFVEKKLEKDRKITLRSP